MGKVATILSAGIAFIGTVLIFASQTKPEDAIISLSAWAKFFGMADVSLPIGSEAITTIVGSIMIISPAVYWSLRKRSKRYTEQEAPAFLTNLNVSFVFVAGIFSERRLEVGVYGYNGNAEPIELAAVEGNIWVSFGGEPIKLPSMSVLHKQPIEPAAKFNLQFEQPLTEAHSRRLLEMPGEERAIELKFDRLDVLVQSPLDRNRFTRLPLPSDVRLEGEDQVSGRSW